MEKNEHLTYFKVKNFKRFKEFELKDITQFNIIVGDNNVGKTSLLEALLFSPDLKEQVLTLINCFAFKFSNDFLNNQKEFQDVVNNVLPLFFNNKDKKEHIFEYTSQTDKLKNLKFEIKLIEDFTDDEKEYLLKLATGNINELNGNVLVLKENCQVADMKMYTTPFVSKNSYDSYIPFSLGYEDDLTRFYSSFIQQNKDIKKNFVESLKSFIPDIESVEITTRFLNHPVIEIFEKSSNEPKLLSTYGDGANKLFRILAEIIVSKGKRLMIDEIDTGIHYSRFEEFWKIILKTAKEFDVQIYATTHNPDCLNYLVDALENHDMQSFQKDTSVFALEELPDKSVKSFKHDYKGFSFLIKKGIEIRGGNNE